MSIHRSLACAVLAVVLLGPAPVSAAHFDVIYADHIDLTLCIPPAPGACPFTADGGDFMLLVNKGGADIVYEDFTEQTFRFTSSVPTVEFSPLLNAANAPFPIRPDEAVGTVGLFGSQVLAGLVKSGETFRNVQPQVFAFSAWQLADGFEGPVTVHARVTLGAEMAEFDIHLDVHSGPGAVRYLSASRVSSTSLPTPATRTSWGRVKSAYR